MWSCVFGWAFPFILDDNSAFIFKGLGLVQTPRWRHGGPAKCWHPPTPQHNAGTHQLNNILLEPTNSTTQCWHSSTQQHIAGTNQLNNTLLAPTNSTTQCWHPPTQLHNAGTHQFNNTISRPEALNYHHCIYDSIQKVCKRGFYFKLA